MPSTTDAFPLPLNFTSVPVPRTLINTSLGWSGVCTRIWPPGPPVRANPPFTLITKETPLYPPAFSVTTWLSATLFTHRTFSPGFVA